MVKRKEESIESLRGFAIILMVAGHVIGNKTNTGLGVAEDSIWSYLFYSFEYLRMPLFTSISGYVYVFKPLSKSNVFEFMKGKSRRILLPFISVATIQFLVMALVPNVNHQVYLKDIWRVYIYGFGQFWFLMSLFQVFIVIAILEYYEITTKFKGWLISFIIGISLIFITVHGNIIIYVFNFGMTIYLFPFFLLGMGIKRFSHKLFHKRVLLYVSIILISGLILQQFNWFKIIDLGLSKYEPLGIIVGFTGILIIFYIRKPNKYLAWLGYYSYGIYLFHIFGTGGSRIISKILGIENNLLLFMIGISFGLGLPIVIEKIILKSSILRRLFLGLR